MRTTPEDATPGDAAVRTRSAALRHARVRGHTFGSWLPLPLAWGWGAGELAPCTHGHAVLVGYQGRYDRAISTALYERCGSGAAWRERGGPAAGRWA